MAQEGEEMAQELEQGVEESLDEKQASGAFSRTLVALVQQICEISSQPVPKKDQNDRYSTKRGQKTDNIRRKLGASKHRKNTFAAHFPEESRQKKHDLQISTEFSKINHRGKKE